MRTSLFLLLGFLGACASASAEPAMTPAAAPAAQERPQSRNGQNGDGMKPYNEVITDEAVTDEGLFHVHTIGDELYYEIPNDQLGKELLFLTRISKTPDGAGYGGSRVNESVVRW